METPETVVALTKENIDKAFNDEPIQLIEPTAPPVETPPIQPDGSLPQLNVPQDPPVQQAPVQQPAEPVKSFAQREYLASLAKKYELEEGLDDFLKDMNEQNADDKVVDFISRNIDYDGYLEKRIHPDLLKLQKQIDEGKPWSEVSSTVAQQASFMNDNERVVAAVLKNEYNFDDAKITSHIAAYKEKGLLDLEADKARSIIDNAQKQYQARESQIAETRRVQHQQTIQREADEAINFFNKQENVSGIPISKADKDEFATYFKKIATPDANGKIPIAEYLQSNENLAKVAFLIMKGDVKFKSQLTNAKESTKKALEDKLYAEPSLRSPSSDYRTPKEIALDNFAAD